MTQPEELYELDYSVAAQLQPSEGANGPVLIHMLNGFLDAGATAETAISHLAETFEPQRLISFDADQLHDYRARRPAMSFEDGAWRSYEAPSLQLDLLRDAEGAPFLLLHGSEPDFKWEQLAHGLRHALDRFDVSVTIGMHGIPMGVPHTRPMSATTHATRDGLLDPIASPIGQARVPGSFSAMLEYRLGEWGYDALGYAIHVPHYLAQSTYPPATLFGLEKIESFTGLDLKSGLLTDSAGAALDEVHQQVAASGEVQELVASLEQQYDSFMRARERGNLIVDHRALPSADELGAQFEEFLAQQGENGSPPTL